MSEVEIDWPWQYSFPPFFTLQPHLETRTKQITAWINLILEYCKLAKLCIIDVREAVTLPLFNNTAIDRKLDVPSIITLLTELQKTGNAAPLDKQKNRWEIYWHTLEEWGSIIYNYISNVGAMNSVMTIFELTQGDDVKGEEFFGLDVDIMIKALRTLEEKRKCELILFDDQQGVKFF